LRQVASLRLTKATMALTIGSMQVDKP